MDAVTNCELLIMFYKDELKKSPTDLAFVGLLARQREKLKFLKVLYDA